MKKIIPIILVLILSACANDYTILKNRVSNGNVRNRVKQDTTLKLEHNKLTVDEIKSRRAVLLYCIDNKHYDISEFLIRDSVLDDYMSYYRKHYELSKNSTEFQESCEAILTQIILAYNTSLFSLLYKPEKVETKIDYKDRFNFLFNYRSTLDFLEKQGYNNANEFYKINGIDKTVNQTIFLNDYEKND